MSEEMTRKRAIGVITLHREHWQRLMKGNVCSKQEGEESIAAFDVALAALSAEPCENAISRQAALDAIFNNAEKPGDAYRAVRMLAPVTPKQSGWIPITYRPATDEEKKDYAARTGYDEEDIDTILNCQLPEDGETVLITDHLGNIEVDTFISDFDGCYFECNCDMEDVKAWMPLPKPYEPQERGGEE